MEKKSWVWGNKKGAPQEHKASRKSASQDSLRRAKHTEKEIVTLASETGAYIKALGNLQGKAEGIGCR